MSLTKSLGLISLATLVGVMTYGCSSTTTSGGTTGDDDSGTSGADSGTKHDSGGGAIDSGGGGTDSGSTGDSGSMGCAPGNVSSFTPPAYVPAHRVAGACLAADITAYYTACLDTTSTQTTCTTFANAKAACAACIEGPKSAASWAAVVDDMNGIASVNLAGCMELAGGANGATCAATSQKSSACTDAACAPSCKVTDDASLQLYEACVQQAAANGCSMYATAAQTCESAEAATDGGASVCLTGQSFQELYNSVAPVFCL